MKLEPLASKCVDHRIDALIEHLPNKPHQRTTPARPKKSELNHIRGNIPQREENATIIFNSLRSIRPPRPMT